MMCYKNARWLVIFFFQAEDGIRDVAVTGVQTCALPICPRGSRGLLGPHSGSAPKKPRGNHARIVEHHELVAREEIRQFAKPPVLKPPRGAVDEQQARSVAVL